MMINSNLMLMVILLLCLKPDPLFSDQLGVEPLVCNDYNLPANAIWVKTANCEDQKQFECRKGYELKVNTTCDEGEWGTVLVCQAVECPDGENITNSNNVTESGSFGEEFSFNCLDGYTLNGMTGTMRCNEDGIWTIKDPCEAPVRLVNGGKYWGRLEVFYEDSWRTVCQDFFDQPEATVVCRQLQLPFSNAIRVPGASYGEGTGTIWLDKLQCIGNETDIRDCPSDVTPVEGGCSHSKDISVICLGDDVTEDNIKVRLVDGPSSLEGRLEVNYGGIWGTVCDDSYSFDDNKAYVVCKMLGVTEFVNAEAVSAKYPGGTGIIWLDNVRCTGYESSLKQCGRLYWGKSECGHSEDVGIKCLPDLYGQR